MAAGAGVSGEPSPWPQPLRLNELAHGPVTRRIVADEAARPAIAKTLGLDRLDALEAELTVSPWQGGAVVEAQWHARIEQTCGVTLEPFGSDLEGAFTVRLLPAEKLAAEAAARDVVIDPEAEDPPDAIEDGRIDLGAYVVEHLALEIDPFPRKPGAVFVAPEGGDPPSPFAVLRDFKAKRGEG